MESNAGKTMKRTLNAIESRIMLKKEERSGIRQQIPVGTPQRNISDSLRVEYRELFPRITLCVLEDDATGNTYYGATMRSKRDRDNQATGKVIAFVRAVDEMITASFEN